MLSRFKLLSLGEDANKQESWFFFFFVFYRWSDLLWLMVCEVNAKINQKWLKRFIVVSFYYAIKPGSSNGVCTFSRFTLSALMFAQLS